MKYYDIMDKEENGYFISFESMAEAERWLIGETKRCPQRIVDNGMHIVENERLTIYEKYERLQQENKQLREALKELVRVAKNIDIKYEVFVHGIAYMALENAELLVK